MNCDDECAAEKTEAKEFAYFSGITTGILGERKRILEAVMSKVCTCRFGFPETMREYYKTSGNQTRESLQAEQDWDLAHSHCGDFSWKTIERIITGEAR
jgi:hypothetical protein